MATVLDLRGLTCPEPVLKTRECLSASHPTLLEIRVDNMASLENVSRFLVKNGYAVEKEEEEKNTWKITASGSGTVVADLDDSEYVACGTGTRKTLVLITSETLGVGDDTLGSGLMGNFLATLPELGKELWRIVLLNGGVKLAVKEGKALDGLQRLAAQGVSVYVCGTCLGHYGLLEEKKVGETTNMLDIVTSLSLADKVIRP
ncbi:MAG: sulfurtransferase-like selenium metabolism protein YedF [Desulfovibrio sp.]|nr:sulfurtransferase-like selenium metabolism protein YedF [Desulfovibrio sp.]